MPTFLSRPSVIALITEAIQERHILSVTYKHVTDNEVVIHQIAPFDIGTTNPKTKAQNSDALWAYSFTHVDKKSNRANPKVCRFDIYSFIKIDLTGERFDESKLAILNLQATKYDYRTCQFALLPHGIGSNNKKRRASY